MNYVGFWGSRIRWGAGSRVQGYNLGFRDTFNFFGTHGDGRVQGF